MRGKEERKGSARRDECIDRDPIAKKRKKEKGKS